MPKPRNLRNDVSAQFVQRHVVGDQRLIRIAGELHRRQPRVPIRRNHRRYRDGTIKIRISVALAVLGTIVTRRSPAVLAAHG